MNHRADVVTAKICAVFPIGGVLISAEDEGGEVFTDEFSFDHFPTDFSADPRISVKKTADEEIEILLRNSRISEQMRLFDISLREVGSRIWNRLSTNRGDRIALALPASENVDPTVEVVSRIDDWMSNCFAAECWENGLSQILTDRWSELIRAVDQQEGGRAAILRLAHAEETFTDWLPMKHVVEVIPELHSAEAIEFSSLERSIHNWTSPSEPKFDRSRADPTKLINRYSCFFGFQKRRSSRSTR